MSATVDRIAARCHRGGLDLVHPLSVGWLEGDILQRLGSEGDVLAVLVGNTKALWPFIRGAQHDHPVERWCEETVAEATDGLGATVFHAHRRYDGAYLPFQRIAHQAGMLHLSPSHLALHARHGPWVALRSLIVVDEPGPTGPPAPAPDPCTPCDKPCLVALEAALGDETDDWRSWLAVRDACPVGRASRYGEPQIAYHYTKDAIWLDAEPDDESS